MPSSSLPLTKADRYQYRLTVFSREPRVETIWAPDWATAWLRAVEQYGGTCRFKVAQYYTLCAKGDKLVVVGELDLPRMSREGFHAISDPLQYDSWLEAKKGFGLPLTETQSRLLAIRRG